MRLMPRSADTLIQKPNDHLWFKSNKVLFHELSDWYNLHLYFCLNDTLIQKSLYSIIPITWAPNNSIFQQLELSFCFFFNPLEPSLVRCHKKVLKYSDPFYQLHRPVFPEKSNLCNRAERRTKCELTLLISPVVTSADK